MSGAPPEWQMHDQWQDRSTDRVERYEVSLRDAWGIVVRHRSDGESYSACVGCAGRQQWAEQLFSDVQGAQDWCEHALVVRTNNEAKQ